MPLFYTKKEKLQKRDAQILKRHFHCFIHNSVIWSTCFIIEKRTLYIYCFIEFAGDSFVQPFIVNAHVFVSYL